MRQGYEFSSGEFVVQCWWDFKVGGQWAAGTIRIKYIGS